MKVAILLTILVATVGQYHSAVAATAEERIVLRRNEIAKAKQVIAEKNAAIARQESEILSEEKRASNRKQMETMVSAVEKKLAEASASGVRLGRNKVILDEACGLVNAARNKLIEIKNSGLKTPADSVSFESRLFALHNQGQRCGRWGDIGLDVSEPPL
jgi:ATPase subunit of ABC transporter with duplicated ATPase domains